MKARGPLNWDRLRDDIDTVQTNPQKEALVLRAARDRFLISAAKERTTPAAWNYRTTFAWGLVAAGLAAGIMLVAQHRRQAEPIHFASSDTNENDRVGAVLRAATNETRTIRFSDGSMVSMSPETAVRVADVSPQGATVKLDEGSVNASVIHSGYAKWQIEAGPFTVHVTGTRFDVRWTPKDQALALDLHEGGVTVTGPSLGPEGRKLLAGESLHVSTGEAENGLLPSPTQASLPSLLSSLGVAPPAKIEDSIPSPSAWPAGHGVVATGAAWKRLALANRYVDALAAAEASHFESVCGQSSASDLLLLANTARFAGAPKRADQAFLAARTNFPGTRQSATAAFSLGRSAYDSRHDFAGAAEWFRTYLREEPDGFLVREAAGRLIEAYKSAGNTAAAAESARAYLVQYPEGPHAALARSILSR